MPLEILRDRLADVVVLDEDELAAGFRLAYARGRVACEVAGSAPIGALAAGRVDTAGARNVVCVVSGGNIDPALAARLLAYCLGSSRGRDERRAGRRRCAAWPAGAAHRAGGPARGTGAADSGRRRRCGAR